MNFPNLFSTTPRPPLERAFKHQSRKTDEIPDLSAAYYTAPHEKKVIIVRLVRPQTPQERLDLFLIWEISQNLYIEGKQAVQRESNSRLGLPIKFCL